MTSSLVGSEMCIRDRFEHGKVSVLVPVKDLEAFALRIRTQRKTRIVPVSYTHLTLPTICSV
eukprot:5270949-Prorocentrum_lima.AAC.1